MKDGSTVPPQLGTVTAAVSPVCAPPAAARPVAGRGGEPDRKFLGSFQNKETETVNAVASWMRSQVKLWSV